MKKNLYNTLLILILLSGLGIGNVALAQSVGPEPKVLPISKPVTPLSLGLHNGIGLNVMLDNFGIGAGGEFRHVISPMAELLLDVHITSLRNVTEQTYQTFFGQIVANKYSRVLALPMMVGLKHRVFARGVSDDFRFYITGSAGPSLAFVYPYFKDYNGNGIRDTGIQFTNGYAYEYEPVNDILSGWKDGHFLWGGSGKLAVGVDFGSKMKTITSLEFGFYMHYYPQGIQMQEPERYNVDSSGDLLGIVPGASKQKYFGTPIISLTFGGMW